MKEPTPEEVQEAFSYATANYGSGLVAIRENADVRATPFGFWVQAELYVDRLVLNIPGEKAARARCDSCGTRYVIDPYICEDQQLWEITDDSMLANLSFDAGTNVACKDCIVIEVKNAAAHEQLSISTLTPLVDELVERAILTCEQGDDLRVAICQMFIDIYGTRQEAARKKEG